MNHWQSDRLVYRGFEQATDLEWMFNMDKQCEMNILINPTISRPPNKAHFEELSKRFGAGLLMVVVVLKEDDPTKEETRLGILQLSKIESHMIHSRNCHMGVSIHPTYQNQGYGSEAIRWALKWGFQHANLHSISLTYFEWNERAGRAYKRIGFVEEGRYRERLYRDGHYYDEILMSILEDEWRTKYPEEVGKRLV